MPSSNHMVELQITSQDVWSFVSDVNNWAPLMPGYITHEKMNDQEINWQFLGDFGFMKKKVTLRLQKLTLVDSTKVTFLLEGVEDPFEGSGYFEVISISNEQTKLSGFLDISAIGLMGMMINNVLKSFVPQMTKELVVAISHEVNGRAVS